MNLADFNTSIRAAIDFYTAQGLWQSSVYTCALPRSASFNQLALTTRDYAPVYEKGLALSHYNFLLSDLSFFQFSHTSETEYALAYYPNPRLSGSPAALDEYRSYEKERDEGHWSDEEFAELASAIPVRTFIPRIRFEYSEKQYKNVRHPGAHFHIGMSGEDRWASARKLSPLTFALLMAKHYHPVNWWAGSRFSHPVEDQNLLFETCLDRKLIAALQVDGVSQFLSEDERMGFHFAALHGAVTT
ncbi:hypothetical protein AA13595_3087 [Gluconacetobacter johannae DSM 13595]|uniref:DUF2290 domain-containing protein n=1 Tax=Gluconacetobacter johannae TaxID=112140 RepID=A0A7W4J8R8_9PROT|nr:DUF2290 domain-containing protein [Gluconacetobacter johannae]MBB2176674.1 DUF2290 domain-containing protein [Gluconacetobacter johannae]GBQ91302.1 hypothetical protein AA13595_3087 [Gluconacetobacter johannae DSM 13595]